MHLGVELLQSPNETEELRDAGLVSPPHGEEVQRNKGGHAQVAKCLLRGWDGGQADP